VKALITGADGFVGRHFRRHLAENDWTVFPVDIASGIDARDVFRKGVLEQQFDLVVHCAAVVGGRKVIDGSPLDQAVNLALDAGLFEWALRTRPKRILYFSSSAVYSRYQQNEYLNMAREYHVRADMKPNAVSIPDALYGWTKLTGEYLAHLYREASLEWDGKVSVVRPFSGYGEDQDASYPFPAFIDRALRYEDPFTVWGDGTQTRDFIHIDDIVGACMEIVRHEFDGPVNLGTGRATSMTELARLVMAVQCYSAPIDYHTDAPRGVSYRVADATLMNKFYQPRVSLEEGIERAIRYRRNLVSHAPHLDRPGDTVAGCPECFIEDRYRRLSCRGGDGLS
jgi:nucleoside-diphosphate-sugar epimerase